jgi:hypothetical protein
MISIADVLEHKLKNSPYILESLEHGLINHSSLARLFHKEIERETKKTITQSALVMAINRLAKKLQKTKKSHKIFSSAPNMIVRSNLFECTITNSKNMIALQKQILEESIHHQGAFLTITSGVFETTIIASKELEKKIVQVIGRAQIKSIITDLASVTIQLDDYIVTTPGAYTHILKILSWDGINITEVVSTYGELTIILKNSDIDRAFSVLKNTIAQ